MRWARQLGLCSVVLGTSACPFDEDLPAWNPDELKAEDLCTAPTRWCASVMADDDGPGGMPVATTEGGWPVVASSRRTGGGSLLSAVSFDERGQVRWRWQGLASDEAWIDDLRVDPIGYNYLLVNGPGAPEGRSHIFELDNHGIITKRARLEQPATFMAFDGRGTVFAAGFEASERRALFVARSDLSGEFMWQDVLQTPSGPERSRVEGFAASPRHDFIVSAMLDGRSTLFRYNGEFELQKEFEIHDLFPSTLATKVLALDRLGFSYLRLTVIDPNTLSEQQLFVILDPNFQLVGAWRGPQLPQALAHLPDGRLASISTVDGRCQLGYLDFHAAIVPWNQTGVVEAAIPGAENDIDVDDRQACDRVHIDRTHGRAFVTGKAMPGEDQPVWSPGWVFEWALELGDIEEDEGTSDTLEEGE